MTQMTMLIRGGPRGDHTSIELKARLLRVVHYGEVHVVTQHQEDALTASRHLGERVRDQNPSLGKCRVGKRTFEGGECGKWWERDDSVPKLACNPRLWSSSSLGTVDLLDGQVGSCP